MGDRLNQVKKEIRSVLMPNKDGLSLKYFLDAHKNFLGFRLPTREFGFTSDIDFLSSLPDVVQISFSNDGSYHLYAVSNSQTDHIQRLVQRQRQPQTKLNSSNQNIINISSRSIVNVSKNLPYIPAAFRQEIIEVLRLYKNGLGYCSLHKAYKHHFERILNIEWLSTNAKNRLRTLAMSIPEIELRVVDKQEKIYLLQETNKWKSERIHDSFKEDVQLSSLNDINCVEYNCEKVLKRYPEGILAVHFPILYQKISGESLELHDLGYNCLLDLVDALPRTFLRKVSTINPKDWLLIHPSNAQQDSLLLKEENYKHHFEREKHLSSSTTSHSSDHMQILKYDFDPKLPFTKPEASQELYTTYTRIFISAVNSPSHFHFQIYSPESISSFKVFENKLQSFYNSRESQEFTMSCFDMLIGSTCVVYCTDDEFWYRSCIVSLPNLEYATVLFVDFGSVEKVHRSKLYYLKYSFMEYPVQAYQAQLANVRPKDKDNEWSRESKEKFLKLCNHISFTAQITSENDGVFSVLLSDCQAGKMVSINNLLVEDGLAEFDDEYITELNSINEASSNDDSDYISHSECSSTESKEIPFGNNVSYLQAESFNPNTPTEAESYLIKKLLLGDGYTLHTMLIEKELFVSSAEVSSLLWPHRNTDYLSSNLRLKNITIPTQNISKDNENLFNECKKNYIDGFIENENIVSVEMYPLKYVIQILNIFGHPSPDFRKCIATELEHFYTSESMWRITDLDDMMKENSLSEKDKLYKFCAYDLKEMKEGLVFRRKKLLSSLKGTNQEHFSVELKQLHALHKKIVRRIAEIEEICFLYSDKDMHCNFMENSI